MIITCVSFYSLDQTNLLKAEHFNLDGNDLDKDGVWVDSDNNRITYTLWPKNYPRAVQNNYLYLRYNMVNTWIDVPAITNSRTFCIKSTTTIQTTIAPTKTSSSGKNLTFMNVVLPFVTLECDLEWTQFYSAGQPKCIKYVGGIKAEDVKDVCAKYGAKAPLPRNSQEK